MAVDGDFRVVVRLVKSRAISKKIVRKFKHLIFNINLQ